MASTTTKRTIFPKDTLALKDHPDIIGTATITWHDYDDALYEELEDVQPGQNITKEAMESFVMTGGQPPLFHLVFLPASPEYPLFLVRESDVILLDRSFVFGDVVKRSATDAISGTVINVGVNVDLVHSGIDLGVGFPALTERYAMAMEHGNRAAKDIPDEELEMASEWEEGDFVIWKNCWLGMLEAVDETVAIRLSNGTVVIPEDHFALEIPMDAEDPQAAQNNSNTPSMGGNRSRNTSNRPRQGAQTDTTPAKISSVPAPENLTVGQQVMTKKANLRRGQWIYGQYDPSIPPIGFVVDVQVSRLTVNWCCQNMAVDNFVPVPQPPVWLEGEQISALRRYKPSVRGLRTPETSYGVANVAVGEKVRFKDLDAAVKKYDGRTVEQGGLGKGLVHKIPRSETMGYDLNTFMVEGTTSWVDVQWQDLTISRHLSRDLTQYPNVDEHELWPGEIVIMKSDTGEDTSTKAPPLPLPSPRANDPNTIMNDADHETPIEVIRPKAVGVIQSVDAKERVAKIRWFENTKMELAGTFMIPGSHTGTLREEVEEVSFYDVVAHQALGVRRGDFVIVVPESQHNEPEPSTDSHGSALFSNALQSFRQSAFLQNMANSPIVSFQSISNFFTSFQGNSTLASLPAPRQNVPSSSASPMDGSVDWFGEVVDLGLDGLVTVRLGALDEIRDVRVPLERLIVVSSEDADINGLDDASEGSSDEDYDSDEDSSDDDDMSVWDSTNVIEERMIYEGGQRIDNDGGEEAWLTDPDDDEMEEDDVHPLDPRDAAAFLINLITSGTDGPSETEQQANTMPQPPAEPYRPPPLTRQSTVNQPAPEAFTIPDHADKPAGFAVLETPIPADHAYASTQPTILDSTLLRRINKEHNILQTSLPEGILVRTWENRLDLLRVLIIGPLNTPYELAPFVFDFHLGPGFPNGPPSGHFHSWTGGVGRVNPNLYEEGKICLSLLGTWHAESSSEGWTVGSSILQLLVSLMGLVLVKEPYFNEAGFGIYVNTEEATLNSLLYSEKAYILARGFIKRVLTRPVAGFEEEIRWLYLPECESRGGLGLLRKVVAGMKEVVARSVARRENGESAQEQAQAAVEVIGAEGVGRVSAGALVLLRRHLTALEAILEEKSNDVSMAEGA